MEKKIYDYNLTNTKEELLYDPKIRNSFLLGNAISNLRKAKPHVKIGFTNGRFRILHPGHCMMLSLCKTHCDILIVAINSDYSLRQLKQDSLFLDKERAFALATLSVVDYVTLFDEENPFKCISEVNPDFVFKGGDYKDKEVVSVGKDVKIIDIPITKHTSDLLNAPGEKNKFFKV